MGNAELELSVAVAEPAEKVWTAVTDWSRQSAWMLGTEVLVTSGDGGLGSQIAAFTGVSGFGVLDTMEITEWEPPLHCQVRHTGRFIKGDGGFHVIGRGPYASTLVWWENLILPFGVAGSLAWQVIRPAFTWGLRKSLADFAEFCGEYSVEGGTPSKGE